MAFAWTPRIALGCALLACGCSATDSDANMGAGGPSTGTPSPGASITFDDTGTLTALPSQSIDVGMTLQGGDTNVTVWLEGDYLDGSLSADVVSSAGGHATVRLRAPATATTFTLGARIAGAVDARISVSVSAGGFATVHVLPTYAGRRPTPTFRASVFVHSTCDDLAKGALKDGAPAVDGTPGKAITIPSVPAGAHVAIAMRVGHYVRGCTDVDALVPEKTANVPVKLYDVPMDLEATDLDVTLTFKPVDADAQAWGQMLGAAAARVSGAFLAGSENVALLDGVRATIAAPSDQAEFDTLRAQYGWDAKTQTWLSAHTPSLHDRAGAWMTAVASDPIGNLALRLTSTTASGSAQAAPSTFSGIAAATLGITAPSPFAWTADAADAVHLSGNVVFATTPLVAHLADGHAVTAVPLSTGVAGALALGIDCAGLMASLVASSALYGQCTVSCATSACTTAIASAWNAASAAPTDASDEATLSVTASGVANVGDIAQPTDFSGAWIGGVASPIGKFDTKGAASAQTHTTTH